MVVWKLQGQDCCFNPLKILRQIQQAGRQIINPSNLVIGGDLFTPFVINQSKRKKVLGETYKLKLLNLRLLTAVFNNFCLVIRWSPTLTVSSHLLGVAPCKI